ncbi:PSD1 and planctomycete cytochrome C domain-containing protein [Pirellulaceae bacterium SH501]
MSNRSTQRIHAFSVALSLATFLLGNSIYGQDPKSDAEGNQAKIDFFESKIRPVLIEHCYECHSASSGDPGGELRLDTAALLKKGGTTGPLLQADAPEKSLLLKALSYDDNALQMPPTGKLPENVLADFRTWVEQGAVDPRTESDAQPAAPSKVELAAKHWAFQPLDLAYDKNQSIDQILARAQSEKKLQPNGPASKRELIRRLYNDLLGVPPTYDEMVTLESQPLENYEKWVDQLLDSPHFGERMARRWMDVARYADNKGYVFQEDREYTHAWRYREWLIRSFNEDLPYDQFTNYQLAADRLEPGSDHRNLDAMGFLTLGRRFLNNENDIADDRIDLVTRGFLGLSVACARCHDHKFDPISMADYYSLHSTFVSSKEPKDAPGPLRMVDADKIRPAVIFKRGQPGARGDQVPRKFIQFISSVSRPMETGSGRLDLAHAITDPKNPLTPRVITNRVWGWVMGAPLVDTPSDFGLRSEAPVQLELLNFLSAEFMADGQSIKRLVKRIVLSDAYRRSSVHDPEKHLQDPENRYWWRGVRKRLDFESLRDAILVGTQQIDTRIGGKSVKMINRPFSRRRTVYAYIDRQNLEGLFRAFDFASPDSHVPLRFATTVPQQALFMMNSEMVDHYSVLFAEKLCLLDEGRDPIWAIDQMFQSILKRSPTEREQRQFVDYLRSLSDKRSGNESKEGDTAAADSPLPVGIDEYAQLIQILLCTNEFCFVD